MNKSIVPLSDEERHKEWVKNAREGRKHAEENPNHPLQEKILALLYDLRAVLREWHKLPEDVRENYNDTISNFDYDMDGLSYQVEQFINCTTSMLLPFERDTHEFHLECSNWDPEEAAIRVAESKETRAGVLAMLAAADAADAAEAADAAKAQQKVPTKPVSTGGRSKHYWLPQ